MDWLGLQGFIMRNGGTVTLGSPPGDEVRVAQAEQSFAEREVLGIDQEAEPCFGKASIVAPLRLAVSVLPKVSNLLQWL